METLRERLTENAPVRALAALGLAVLLIGMAGVVLAARGTSDEGAAPAATGQRRATAQRPQPLPPPPRLRVVPLTAVGAFDPEGDGAENDELAAAAVDRNPESAWRTERYSSFFKDGVGLVLDARRPFTLARILVSTDTPGFVAGIRAGASPAGPFRPVSAERTVAGRTAFTLRRARARYVLVWITDLPAGTAAHVTEVRAVARRR